ncbi:hypothetical protein [Oribacterium sinus]|uniref:hypothetical protein n=1 Tax=Oribacterium sinus TaxID=237576 RepID=UPI0028F03E20|nr:hypothetical protein [Oribacterium sinus]
MRSSEYVVDTVGAVAGGLSAMIHGLGGQGEKWLKSLRNKELILECLWDDKTLLSPRRLK